MWKISGILLGNYVTDMNTIELELFTVLNDNFLILSAEIKKRISQLN